MFSNIHPHFSVESLLQQIKRVLLELSEEEVDVVCGVELCDEGLDVLQENLWKEMDTETWPVRNTTLVLYINALWYAVYCLKPDLQIANVLKYQLALWTNEKMWCQKNEIYTTKPFTYLWVVVINEVQVDPQLPHTLKSISEPQTENRKTKQHAGQTHSV